jgi:hypothetical protein
MRPPCTASVFALLTVCASICPGLPISQETAVRAGELQSVREAVRKESDASADAQPKKKKEKKRSQRTDCDDEGFRLVFGEVIGKALFVAASSPWWIPHVGVDDDLSDWGSFPSAPYDDGHDGYLVIETLAPIEADGLSVRLWTEYGTDFDDLSRIGTRLIVDTAPRFGLDAEWNQWFEETGTGDDTLSTGDVNLVYRFAQHERIQFRSGLGVNWLNDSHDADFGFNFTYGFDAFPVEPVIVSGTLDLGRIGDASLVHVRSTAGLVWKRAELFTGYDYQRIGPVDLHGLVAGLQFWF